MLIYQSTICWYIKAPPSLAGNWQGDSSLLTGNLHPSTKLSGERATHLLKNNDYWSQSHKYTVCPIPCRWWRMRIPNVFIVRQINNYIHEGKIYILTNCINKVDFLQWSTLFLNFILYWGWFFGVGWLTFCFLLLLVNVFPVLIKLKFLWGGSNFFEICLSRFVSCLQ